MRWLAGVAAAFAVASSASAASALPAVDARPVDAPRFDTSTRMPPLPPEYLHEDGVWIRFAYHPAARERVRELLPKADAVRGALVGLLGPRVLDTAAPVEVRVAALASELPRLVPIEARAAGEPVALLEPRVVVLAATAGAGAREPDLEASFRHALAHVALDDALGGSTVPRYFVEGFASYFEAGSSLSRGAALSSAVLGGGVMSLGEMATTFPLDSALARGSLVGAEAAEFARFVAEGGAPNQRRLVTLTTRFRAGEPFDRALEATLGADSAGIDRAFRERLRARFGLFPAVATLVAVLVAVVAVVVRRRVRMRAARASLAAIRRRAEGARELRLVAVRALRPRGSRDDEDDDPLDEDDDAPMPTSDRTTRPPSQDPGVPRVEHGGRWHTLH